MGLTDSDQKQMSRYCKREMDGFVSFTAIQNNNKNGGHNALFVLDAVLNFHNDMILIVNIETDRVYCCESSVYFMHERP